MMYMYPEDMKRQSDDDKYYEGKMEEAKKKQRTNVISKVGMNK